MLMAWRQVARRLVSSATARSLLSTPTSITSTSRRYGLLKIWPWCYEPVSLAHLPKFKPTNLFGHSLQSQGRKLLTRCFLGTSAAAVLMLYQPSIAYAMDENLECCEEPSVCLKDEFNTLWALTRKYHLPAVLLIMVAMGWSHPVTLAINILLFLYCTRPSPFSIYLFVLQLQQGDLRQSPSWLNSTFLYAKEVHVRDHKLFCLGEVKLGDEKLHVIGILGGWWVLNVSRG